MKSERDTTQRFTHRANLTQWRKISSGHLTPAERDFVDVVWRKNGKLYASLPKSSRREVHTP
jgi:hypothetical protein